MPGIVDQITSTNLKNQNLGNTTYVGNLQSVLGGSPLLNNVFQNTNLDIENPSPNGGPNNDPASGFTHTYLPTYRYEDHKPG